MLQYYITAYIKARKEGNAKEMRRIEKDLFSLGMDKATLTMLANELEKG